MAIERMEHVGIVVDDLAAATAFFVELGMERQGAGTAEGDWVDRIIGLDGSEVDFAMLETPDGGGRVELVSFRSPPARGDARNEPANTRGLRHLAFRVDDLDDVLARLAGHGAELVREVVR